MGKNQSKNRYLRKNALPRNHQWQWDFDYIDALGDKEKIWLNKFIGEYYDTHFDKSALHKTKTQRRERYSHRNRQNRDATSIFDANGKAKRNTP